MNLLNESETFGKLTKITSILGCMICRSDIDMIFSYMIVCQRQRITAFRDIFPLILPIFTHSTAIIAQQLARFNTFYAFLCYPGKGEKFHAQV